MGKIDDKDALVVAPKVSKKQIIGVICFAVCAILALGGIITAFVLNFTKTVPSQLRFLDREGEFYFQAVPNDNYFGYIFKFYNVDTKQEYLFSQDDSLLYVNDLEGLELGATYQVSVCYKGEVEGGNTEFSRPYNYTMYKYLGTPQVSIKEDSIEWDPVEDAREYKVYYGDTNLLIKTTEETSIGFEQLPVGKRKIIISAVSDKKYLYESLKPAVVEPTVTHEVAQFVSVTFSQQTNLLQIVSKDRFVAVDIKIGESVKRAEEFDVINNSNGTFTFTINIAAIVGDSVDISAKPVPKLPYYVYKGDFTKATIK